MTFTAHKSSKRTKEIMLDKNQHILALISTSNCDQLLKPADTGPLWDFLLHTPQRGSHSDHMTSNLAHVQLHHTGHRTFMESLSRLSPQVNFTVSFI